MKRREFIFALGGAAVGWPLAARAQQTERVRRIGVLMNTTPDEPDSQARITALAQGLQEAGWAIGRNLRIDTAGSPATDCLMSCWSEWTHSVRQRTCVHSLAAQR